MTFGWVPDRPDIRDFTICSPGIAAQLSKASTKGRRKRGSTGDKEVVDLREWCPPIEDQGTIGSCTANAGIGIVEYFERRTMAATSKRRASFYTRRRATFSTGPATRARICARR